MADIIEQITAIEDEIRKTPYHKATEHHIGKLRAKLSRLRTKEQDTASRKSGGGGGYSVKKQGDATIVLIGPPSAGKSTLLNQLTNAKSRVAPYSFTTLTVVPGMMHYNDANIQILDVPGLIEGAETGKGRGKEVLSVARGANLIVFLTDPQRENIFTNLENTLYENGVRINVQPPSVTVEKMPSGSIALHSNIKQDLDDNTIKAVAREMGIKNAQITIREKLTLDRAVDAFSTNRVYVPAIYVINKMDTEKNRNAKYIYISADKNKNLNKLRQKIWENLNFTRIYLIKPTEEPNDQNPIIVKRGLTLSEIAASIGEDFAKDKTKAKLWGNGAKYPGQTVSLSKVAQEDMQVRYI